MRIRADRTEPAHVQIDDIDWVPSPSPGVDRRMLERIGDEVAVATTVVRYAPNSRFPTHVHGGGEEFLVLEGVFSDEHGDYPVGTYVRNPPGTAHAPFTEQGCTIFVKLRQMPEGDAQTVVPPEVDVLHDDVGRGVHVRRRSWSGEHQLGPEGHELLLLEGALTHDGERLTAPAWIRLPNGRSSTIHAEDASVWHKWGHLG
jgi:hypothetical protein